MWSKSKKVLAFDLKVQKNKNQQSDTWPPLDLIEKEKDELFSTAYEKYGSGIRRVRQVM